MELMVVVIAVSILAGFAIPSYKKAVERQYRRIGEQNLVLIHSANQAYQARYGGYWPVNLLPWQDITAINTTLKLKIEPNGFTYVCAGSGGTTFSCYAYRGAGPAEFTLTVTQAALSGTNPDCTDGTEVCP